MSSYKYISNIKKEFDTETQEDCNEESNEFNKSMKSSESSTVKRMDINGHQNMMVEDERYPLVNPPVFVDVDNGKDFENVVVKKEVMEDFNESSVISEVHRALASCLPNTSEDSLPEWSNDETSILIDIWEEHIIHFRKYGRNDDIYQQIADRLQIISCTKHKRTAREIKYKLEMLKRIYKANQKKASKKGLNHVKWKFYNKIEKFLHPSPFYETPIPIESCILNTSQDSSPEWSNDETNVLIDLWEKHIIYLRKYGRNVNINRQIAEELQDILQTRHKRTAREIKDKLEMLKRIYNANKKKVIRKGLSRPKWKFYSKIEKVLHPSPLFDPSGRSDLNAVNLDMSGESVSQKEVDVEPPVEMPLKCILQEGEASIETSLPACTNGSGFQDSSSLQKCQSTSLLPNQTSLGDQKSEFAGLVPTQTSLGDQKPQLNSSPENPFSFFLVLKPQPNSIPDNQASLSVQNSQFTSPATDQNTHLTSTQANQTSSLSDQKPESTSLLVNRTSNGILKPGCPSPPGNQIVSGIQKLEPTSPPGSQTLSVSQKIECTSPPGNLTFSGTHTPESPGSPGNQTFYGIEKHEAPSPPRNQTLPGTQKLELTSPPGTQQPESTSPPTPRRKTRNRKNLNESNLQLTPDKTERRTCNCGALFEKQITENRNMYERLIMVEKETNKSNMKELMIMEKEKSEKVADDLKELLLMEKTRNDRLGSELQELNQKLRSSEMKLAVSENERERWQENERKWENEREQWVRKEERLTEEIEKWKRKASSRIELEDWKAKMGL